MTVIRRKTLGDLFETQLGTVAGVTVFRGEVPAKPPLIQTAGQDDPSGRIAPYVAFFPSAGRAGIDDEFDLANVHEDLVWTVQLLCAAGYAADLDALIDRVWAAIFRWTPVSDGLAFGAMEPPPGYDPGPMRRNDNVTPPRFWTPMQFQLPVTT